MLSIGSFTDECEIDVDQIHRMWELLHLARQVNKTQGRLRTENKRNTSRSRLRGPVRILRAGD